MIPSAYERRCIGRQIRRTLRSGTVETGTVIGLNRQDPPLLYFDVTWSTTEDDDRPVKEVLALTTLQMWFSEQSDTYVDDGWVDEELRVLQKVDWNVRRVPQKDSKEWKKLLNQPIASPAGADKQAGRGRRSAAAQPKAIEQASTASAAQEDQHPTSANIAPQQQAAVAATSPNRSASKSKVGSPIAEPASNKYVSPGHLAAFKTAARKSATNPLSIVGGVLNSAADVLKEAPQILGNKISDALPGSSKRKANSRQAAASAAQTATASKALSTRDHGSETMETSSLKAGKDETGESTPNTAEQQLRDAIGRTTRASVTGGKGKKRSAHSRAAAEQEPAVKRRSTRKDAKAAPAPAEEDMEVDIDEAGDTADQGNSGGDNAASPAQQPLDGSEAEAEEMLELPDGFNPTHIPISLALQPGDRKVEEYAEASFDSGEEFVVDAVVAEKKMHSGWAYLVKWKGFELNPAELTPEHCLSSCKALDLWEQQQGRAKPAKKTARKKTKRG